MRFKSTKKCIYCDRTKGLKKKIIRGKKQYICPDHFHEVVIETLQTIADQDALEQLNKDQYKKKLSKGFKKEISKTICLLTDMYKNVKAENIQLNQEIENIYKTFEIEKPVKRKGFFEKLFNKGAK